MPPDSDSFFGIDLQTRSFDERLTGVGIDSSGGPITAKTLEDACERISQAFMRPPCGMEGNPHLVVPRPIGKMTYCCQCGHPSVRVSQNEWRELNEEELQAGVDAMVRASAASDIDKP